MLIYPEQPAFVIRPTYATFPLSYVVGTVSDDSSVRNQFAGIITNARGLQARIFIVILVCPFTYNTKIT